MDKTEIKPTNGNELNGKNKIEVKSSKQREWIKKAGIGAAILGLGTGAYAIYNRENEDNEVENNNNDVLQKHEPETDPNTDSDSIVIYTEAPVATLVNDDMTFDEGFSTARNEVGPGGFFVWHDNVYNTYYKDEWDLMSQDEKQQYLDSININEEDHFVDNDMQKIDTDTIDIPIYEDNSSTIDDSIETQNNIISEDINNSNIDATNEVSNENVNSTEEQWIEIDIDGDGVIDGVVTDFEGDGLVDALLIDSNGNEVPDVLILNSDDIPGLDITVLDPLETGNLDESEIIEIGEQVIIDISNEVTDESPQDYLENNYDEPLPDIDNNVDVSDFEDPSIYS